MGANCSACGEYMENPYMEFTEEGQRWAFCMECSDDYRVEKEVG